MHRTGYAWMIRVLMLVVILGAIPLAAGGARPLQASGTGGTAYAWGYNADGELGDGDTTQSTTPVQVSLPTGVMATAMAAGASHSLAIDSGGKLYAWGSNARGELGNGSTTGSDIPVLVSLPPGVTASAIAAGGFHSLAIGSDGKLYAWGGNGNGQLGNGSTTDSSVPMVVTLPSGVTPTAIATGTYHSLVSGSNGKLYAWGYNNYGQLGNGSTTESHTPVLVLLPSGVTARAVAAGYEHSLASGSDGKLYAWGQNFDGELGNGTSTNSYTPVVVSLPSGVTASAIATGQYHSLAIGSDGKLYAWGNNFYGELGDGTTNDSYIPVAVNLPAGVTARAVAAGSDHGLAIGSDGKLYAWGFNGYGQLGNGSQAEGDVPVLVHLPSGTTPLALGTGPAASHSLAILSSSPTAALVAHFRVAHLAHGVVFHWRVASTTGILGFSLTSGTRQLNRTLIAVHAGSQRYRYTYRVGGSGSYVLHVVLQGGGSIAIVES